MKKKLFRERHGYTVLPAYEEDTTIKKVVLKAVKKAKNYKKKKSDK